MNIKDIKAEIESTAKTIGRQLEALQEKTGLRVESVSITTAKYNHEIHLITSVNIDMRLP